MDLHSNTSPDKVLGSNERVWHFINNNLLDTYLPQQTARLPSTLLVRSRCETRTHKDLLSQGTLSGTKPLPGLHSFWSSEWAFFSLQSSGCVHIKAPGSRTWQEQCSRPCRTDVKIHRGSCPWIILLSGFVIQSLHEYPKTGQALLKLMHIQHVNSNKQFSFLNSPYSLPWE